MAPHWYCLFLGVVLTQGLFALSPIPVPEEEWIEFSRMLRDPQYRLPRTSIPQKYQVTLTPYLDITSTPNVTPFTFDGEVTIDLTVLTATNEIVLHCNDLTIHELTLTTATGIAVALENNIFTCEMPYSFLRVRATSQLTPNTQYTLKSRFSGNLQTNMRGFYRSWYKDSNGQKRWLGSTQFQPGHARQAFPCYDEPSFKALFDITIIRDSTLQPTVSNMPIKATEIGTGRVSETFYTTPKTSTYLLGFIVSDFEIVATNNNATHPFHIYARTTASKTGDFALDMGIKLLDIMTDYTNIPYYEMAPNIDMKQAAIPDFSAGAMENWGMLTYREAFLLYDEDNSNHWYKQRIANVIGHEVAHQWFGNLVTCSWWDNLWLNEAFGRFYQYYLAEMGAPEMGFNTRFIVEQLRVSMLSDSVDSAHALTNPDVNDPASVSAHFSTITYARGASMLRMTQYLLGDGTFVKGLRKFLDARKFDVADPSHLFSALDEAAREDGALANYNGVTIKSYFRTWSERAGHPLLTVTVNQTSGQVRINQARWERDTGMSQYSQIWQIPITWTRANVSDFDDLKPSLIITEAAASFNRGTSGPEWILLNKQQTSFYRVNYDHNNWVLLTRALRSNSRTAIHEFNRAQLVDDLFNGARSGIQIYPNMRPWVYCNGLRQGTAEDFTFFWNKYLDEQLATEVVVMLTAAGCTKDTAGLETFLSAIINADEIIRPQDVSTALSSAVTSNEENTMKVLNWLNRNIAQVNSRLGSASTFVSNIGGRLRNEAQITEFQNWLDGNREVLGAAYTTGVNSIATTRRNMAWSANRLSEFTTYFDKGYVEEELDLDEAEEVEEEDPEEDTGGDASAAALSTILLLITVSINMYA
ncbi:unnamed protein product [Pieris macdunnoughi]|uniref:Aminopeptidase n=1 Tax=Pieris macdunnoughi TaxID=345717 RepID=A0A821YTS2_9NEOP|nr:unnamed protein product [Pieris macdunnoughi]